MCLGVDTHLSTLILDQSLKILGFDHSSLTLLWEEKREASKDLEVFTLQVPDTLCKAKGFVTVILSWNISLITDLLIHVSWSCQQ